ncbi:hypothetical protein JCM13580A_56160 [Streptomyces drozdowiczii]
MTTHVYEDWVPCRSAMIRGRALETTVEARMATNMPAIRPDMAWSIWRRVMPDAGPSVGPAAPVSGVTAAVIG